MILKNKYLMIILAVIIIKTNFSINVQAKEYNRFNNISIEDGLSQATVETMMQDSKGYIWLGTNDGLDRYNGYTFKKYTYEKGKHCRYNTVCPQHNAFLGRKYGLLRTYYHYNAACQRKQTQYPLYILSGKK